MMWQSIGPSVKLQEVAWFLNSLNGTPDFETKLTLPRTAEWNLQNFQIERKSLA